MIALSMSVLYENSHLLPSTLGVKSSSWSKQMILKAKAHKPLVELIDLFTQL
jgi:hypothetical protein